MVSTKFFYSAISFFAYAQAQRPSDVPICDYYAQKVLQANNVTTQYKLMQLILHTAVLGNYSQYNVGIKVNGAANKGTFNGVEVNLLPFFTGELASTNDGVTPHGISRNFLDDGGTAPLLNTEPSNGNTSSYQYKFFTHVYSYFGTFLGCSQLGTNNFPTYQGKASMYEVHRYMDLDINQQSYFIEQVALTVASLGFNQDDVSFINSTLYKTFNYRCSAAAAVVPPDAGPQLQSICIADNCPLDTTSNCSAYPNKGVAEAPQLANQTSAGNPTSTSGNSTSTGGTTNGTSSSGAAQYTGAGWGGVTTTVGTVVAALLFAFVL